MDGVKILDLAVELEEYLAELYFYFYEIFPEDASFWYRMANEELNHASLIKSAEAYDEVGLLPDEMIYKNIEDYKSVIKKIDSFLKDSKSKTIGVKEAFKISMEIENSASEIHFQKVMTEKTSSKVIEILQKLNNHDIDHIKRLEKYFSNKLK